MLDRLQNFDQNNATKDIKSNIQNTEVLRSYDLLSYIYIRIHTYTVHCKSSRSYSSVKTFTVSTQSLKDSMLFTEREKEEIREFPQCLNSHLDL